MGKTAAKQGFIKQLSSKATPATPNKTFTYNKPISKIDKIQNMAVNSRTREHRSSKQDSSTNFAIEQKNAKQSHKGSK
jgi:hypothetical protein